MASAALLERLSEAKDTRKALLGEVGDLSGVDIFSAKVLVAIYIGPSKMKSGLYRPPSQLKEDVYQGAVGLVLKKGPMAFKDDGETKFHGQDVAVGDWVTFVPGEGKRIQISEVDCRMLDDTSILMRIKDPTIITHSK